MVDKPKILVIKLGALGDFIQATGPMKAIRKHHSDAHITLLTTKPFKKFAESCGYFDDIWLDEKPKWYQPRSWYDLRNKLNKARFTRVYDLQNNDRTALYFKLFSPKPEWVGAAKGASHENNSPLRTAGSALEGHRQTLSLAGISKIEIDNLDWVQSDTSQFGIKTPYVLFAAGSAPDRPEKRWPAKHYGSIAQQLSAQGITPVLLGTIAEASVNQTIKKMCPGVADLTAKTTLADIISLGRNANAAIGNDTGPMHMIAPTGCPSLVLFSGHSNPDRHAPTGAHVHVLQEDNLTDLKDSDVIDRLFAIMNGQSASQAQGL